MPDNLKKIYTPIDNLEADLIRNLLEQADIYCFIQGYQHRSMLGIVGPYVDLGIMVPDDKTIEATEIIKEFLNFTPKDSFDREKKVDDGYSTPLKRLRSKSIRVGVVLPLILPGAGSCYIGNANLGMWIIGSYLISLSLTGFLIGLDPYSLGILPSLMSSTLLTDYILLFVFTLIILDIVLVIRFFKSKAQKDCA